MNNEIVKTLNLSKKYTSSYGDISVIKNINLKINRGDFVSLIGPSGSGKSTFLHLLALLDNPTSGEVIFNG